MVFFGFRWEKMKIKNPSIGFPVVAGNSVSCTADCMYVPRVLAHYKKATIFLIRPNRTGQSEPAVGGDACGGEQYAVVGMAL